MEAVMKSNLSDRDKQYLIQNKLKPSAVETVVNFNPTTAFKELEAENKQRMKDAGLTQKDIDEGEWHGGRRPHNGKSKKSRKSKKSKKYKKSKKTMKSKKSRKSKKSYHYRCR